MPQQHKSIDRVFRALADPTRRAVLKELTKGQATCSELAEPYSMALPSFMQHIDMLEDAGLISSYKTGRVRICKLTTASMKPAEEWIKDIRAVSARSPRKKKKA